MGGYVGSSRDKQRLAKLDKEREAQRKKFEDAKKTAQNTLSLRQFGAAATEAAEAAFKNETVGLVTRQEFAERRATADEKLALASSKRAADQAALTVPQASEDKAKKARMQQRQKLSFDDGESEDEEEAGGLRDRVQSQATAGPRPMGKDPSVRADFLPDRERDLAEAALREQLRTEWLAKQSAIKAEPLEITFSYYNGTGHRRSIQVLKGDTVGKFVASALEQLAQQFRELRVASPGSLMYVKEDVILPPTVTFYDLILAQARGKSGPLFQFDLQEHTTAVVDPRVKSQDSHAGKIVDRTWYQKNKHVYPASRWEVYDPDKHCPAPDEAKQ
ncbi:XAP5 circadian clock regulator protein [Helicosporidium sp. ATCC 50920]|nr:XAP5 circadian clock regulator protein [Helicosporidium sp. ATCC 50920]|eukprot:KDD76722.1 XAP5 circadian clock regulator protein [Helicosporidium sp. ATCC 50920]